MNQQKVGDGSNNNNSNSSGGRSSPTNIKSELGKQSPGESGDVKSGVRSPSPMTDPGHMSPRDTSPAQHGNMKDDRGKWSPLTTVNTAQLGVSSSTASHPAGSASPTPGSKHFSPPPPPSSGYYPPPPSHAPYQPNTFSSPLSALLGTGSHYLFNSESKGPTVQIF